MFEIVSTCKGGGYRYCRTVPPHPRANANGLYPLHRVLMENRIGRLLETWEHVHHRDGDKSNDSIENLELLTASQHARIHALESAPLDVALICPQCEALFFLKKARYKRNLRMSKRGLLFCSIRCSATHQYATRARNAA